MKSVKVLAFFPGVIYKRWSRRYGTARCRAVIKTRLTASKLNGSIPTSLVTLRGLREQILIFPPPFAQINALSKLTSL